MSTSTASTSMPSGSNLPALRSRQSKSSVGKSDKPVSSVISSSMDNPPNSRTDQQPHEIDDIEAHEGSDEDLEEEDDEEDDGYPSLDPAQTILPVASFSPLFAMIRDPNSTEAQHPSIYYVFSDDAENEREGNDVATIASLTALRHVTPNEHGQIDEQDTDSEIEERFVILDLEPSLDDNGPAVRIKNMSSLCPQWAVTSASLRPAPTLDDENPQDGSLMLQLEGIEIKGDHVQPTIASKGKSKNEKQTNERAAELLEEARKNGSGNILDGMSDIYKSLHHGLAVLDQLSMGTEEGDIET